jgi:hypothetical protein
MIPLEEQLTTILTPICGDELYPIGHPDPDGEYASVATSFTIFTVVGGQSYNNLEGDAGISRVRLQISIYAMDYTEFKVLQRAINAAMQAANLLATNSGATYYDVVGAIKNVSTTVPTEGKEPDTKRFYAHMDYYVWTNE